MRNQSKIISKIGDSPKWTKTSIFFSAFGIGNYRQESDLREQGINGHIEMAAAFDRAKFESVDVHMSDILWKVLI